MMRKNAKSPAPAVSAAVPSLHVAFISHHIHSPDTTQKTIAAIARATATVPAAPEAAGAAPPGSRPVPGVVATPAMESLEKRVRSKDHPFDDETASRWR